MTAIPPRFRWAADLVKINKNDRVLEIGSGSGLLAERLLHEYPDINLILTDRSAPMMEKARGKLATTISSGKVLLIEQEFASLIITSPVDVAIAFNVSFFWKNEQPEMANLTRVLKPGAGLHLFFEQPYRRSLTWLEQHLEAVLISHGFSIFSTEKNADLPRPCLHVLAHFR